MREFIVQAIESFGYWGVAFLAFLENVFPPLPSEVILPAAGFAAVQGELSTIGVGIGGTIGSVLGTSVFYVLGRWWGEEPVRAWIRKHGKWLTLEEQHVDRAHHWFERHGGKAVLLGRCIPGVRALISLPAGFARMPLAPFLLYTTVGTAIWNGALVAAGVTLGRNYDAVSSWIGAASTVVSVCLAGAAVLWIAKRKFGGQSGQPAGS